MTKQQQFSQNLRNLAAWYDRHPDAPTPERYNFAPQISAPLAMSAEAMEAIGPSEAEVNPSNDLYYRVVKGDGFTIKFYSGLKSVCDFKVIRQETVDVKEWVIKPELLAPVEELANV